MRKRYTRDPIAPAPKMRAIFLSIAWFLLFARQSQNSLRPKRTEAIRIANRSESVSKTNLDPVRKSEKKVRLMRITLLTDTPLKTRIISVTEIYLISVLYRPK